MSIFPPTNGRPTRPREALSCLCYEYVKPTFAAVLICLAVTGSSPAGAKEIGEYSSYQDSPKKPPSTLPEAAEVEQEPEERAAVQPEELPAAPEVKAAEAYAEPISPQTVARFPHLKVYQGHLLLGGVNLQVVLAGVPAKEVGPGWQTALLAVFERRDGAFRRSAALATLDLSPAGEQVLFPVGVDLGAEKAAKLAFVTQVYGATDPKTSKQTMTWRLDAEQGTLAVVMADFGSAGTKSPKGGHKWRIRLTGRHAESVTGKNYWIRAADADVASFLPYRQMSSNLLPEGLILEQAAGEAPPVDGFELLLGRDATGRTLVRAANLEDCLHGTQRPRKPLKEEAKLPWLLSCQTSLAKTTLRLTSAPGETGAVVRPLYVFSSDGLPVLYTALEGSKDTVDVLLPNTGETTYQVADTRYGRQLPGSGVIAPDGRVVAVEVPIPDSGLLRLSPGGSKASAILSVTRLDRSGGVDAGIVAAGDGDSHLRIAANRLLIRSWPADLELEAGGYELSLSRGGEGRICTVRAVVQRQRRVVLGCGEKAAPTPKEAVERTWIDLAAAEGSGLPLQSLKQALGVDLLAEPVDETGGRAGPLRVLRAEDEATGTVLSFVPATSVLAGRWERQKKTPSAQDLAARFVRLVRGEGGQGLVELGCPAPGTSAFDYELLVQRLQPDAVRLFGCEGESKAGEWLALYDRLAAARRVPYLLTSESGLRATSGRAPRILLRMSPKALQQKPETAVNALLEGAYEVSAGGGVTLTKVTRTPKTGMVADVAYEATDGLPTVLALYGDKGLIKEEKISAAKGSISVALHKLETGWLRAELRNDGGVIATTTAMPLSRLLPKEGESH